MKVSSRIARVISGTVHSSIKRLEDQAPEIVLEENVREMRVARRSAKDDLGRILVDRHNALKNIRRCTNANMELEAKLETAIRSHRDDLAKAALGRQIDLNVQTNALNSVYEEADKMAVELRNEIALLDSTIREREEQLRDFKIGQEVRDPTHVYADGEPKPQPDHYVRLFEEADESFQQILERNTGLKKLPVDLATEAAIQDLEDLAREEEINKRLKKIKEELAGDTDEDPASE